MQYHELPNGALRFTADNEARSDLARAYVDGGYHRAESLVIDGIVGKGLSPVAPEHIGALTYAPIFSDGFDFEDDGTPCLHTDAKVWWFPDYMIRDPWAELRNTGRVDFALAA